MLGKAQWKMIKDCLNVKLSSFSFRGRLEKMWILDVDLAGFVGDLVMEKKTGKFQKNYFQMKTINCLQSNLVNPALLLSLLFGQNFLAPGNFL